MEEKLKIGLLMESYELPLWKYTLIERLINSHYAEIELLVLKNNDTETPEKSILKKIIDNKKNLFYILYSKLDAKLFKIQPNAFKLKDTKTLLQEVPLLKVKTTNTKFSDHLKDEDIVDIKNRKIDVFIKLGFKTLEGEILRSSTYGVWSYSHDDNNVIRGGPAGFWEVMENRSVTGSSLQILSEDMDTEKILYRSYSPTNKRSVHRNKNAYYWKTLSFIPRKLEELYRLGGEEFFKRVDKQNEYPSFYTNKSFSSSDLNNWKMIKLFSTLVFSFIKDRVIRLVYIEQWILLFNIKKGLSTSFCQFEKIIPPKNNIIADPFIIEKDNTYYIYIEEISGVSNKGHISVIEMDKKGNHGKPITIIEKPYHLSYPFIFDHKGDYFLIPESGENKTIDLYKCVEFPLKWEFQTSLMEGLKAVDTTLFFHQNKWWLFTNISENPGTTRHEELFLFYSNDLYTKNWTPHPLNPVVSDINRARPAGKIFTHKGKILRPSQNCSKRYGYALKISEITVLNENEYEEIEISSMEPNWDDDIKATHTFNNEGDLTIIDGIYRRNRFF